VKGGSYTLVAKSCVVYCCECSVRCVSVERLRRGVSVGQPVASSSDRRGRWTEDVARLHLSHEGVVNHVVCLSRRLRSNQCLDRRRGRSSSTSCEQIDQRKSNDDDGRRRRSPGWPTTRLGARSIRQRLVVIGDTQSAATHARHHPTHSGLSYRRAAHQSLAV